jgi:hypothetical protein
MNQRQLPQQLVAVGFIKSFLKYLAVLPMEGLKYCGFVDFQSAKTKGDGRAV